MDSQNSSTNIDSTFPVVDESQDDVTKTPKERLLNILDKLENHVETLRKESLALEERKDSIFIALDAIKGSDLLSELGPADREDIDRYMDSLSARATTVDIFVRTDRDVNQQDALYQVNGLIDTLVTSYKVDASTTATRCSSYLACCSSSGMDTAGDKTFENALLGCALDDQKKIKKRLQGLLNYMNQGDLDIIHM